MNFNALKLDFHSMFLLVLSFRTKFVSDDWMIDRGYMEVPTELKSQWYIIHHKPVELNLRFYFILSIQCLCSMVKFCYITCSFTER